MASTVALVRCDSYDEKRVYDAVGRAFELLGGAERFVELGESIVLKPNLLVASTAEQHVTTHPSVFRAVAAHLHDEAAHLSWGDSPGFGRPEAVARKAGLSDAIEEMSQSFADKQNALFLGRGTFYPIAMEGALKLKEISYIHAEAYAAGELKHGPLRDDVGFGQTDLPPAIACDI